MVNISNESLQNKLSTLVFAGQYDKQYVAYKCATPCVKLAKS